MLKNNKGFSLLELVVAIAIFAILMGAVVTFFLSMNNSSIRTTASRDVTENARRALDEITYEIRSAKGVYTPTTTASQLSLETLRYLPSGENDTFIDFFLCGTAVCLKKESQEPVAITSNSVQVTSLSFTQISTGTTPSIKVSLTMNSGSGSNYYSTSLTSTASLRAY